MCVAVTGVLLCPNYKLAQIVKTGGDVFVNTGVRGPAR